uniref:Dynein light intermediate chain n=1 Tax=Macaca fascicularis TaxID=9541 RepID=A0A7N9CFV0_MACFA
MAAVGRVGSFGSSPPGLSATYTGGPLGNEIASGNGGAAAGDDEDGSCILSEVSTRSRSKLPAEELIRDFQEYVEPGEDFPDKDDSVVLPLGADTLTHNLGIPVLVVCTKCDAISVLEKEHDYRDEHFDFIQSHIRKFCLQYGAALIYTSVKENKNIDLVYKYIVQKLYGFPYKIPAVVVEKDAVFIPAGWDNDKKIGILHENFQTLKKDNFEDIITKPPVRKFVHEKEIMAEDDQVFLMKLQQPPTAAGRPVDASPRVPGAPRTPNRSVSSNVASITHPCWVKKIDPNMKAGATSEGVLANFFNSLLSKKTGSPGGPGVSGGSPAGGAGGGSSGLPPSLKSQVSLWGASHFFKITYSGVILQPLPPGFK